MAVITTTELFDKYFETKDPEVARKTRPQIDRPEVYAYEQKIGKQLIDMNVDELFEMLATFNYKNNGNTGGTGVSYNSYPQIASSYRALFEFYIDNYDDKRRNPWYNKRMRGTNADERLAENMETFNWKTVEDAVNKIRGTYDNDKANYLECLILLFYNGFAKAEEIVVLKEDMINFKNKQVRLPGRTIVLSDRCFALLTTVHKMEMIEGWRGNYIMVSYHGGYFKFIIRPSEFEEFDKRPPEEIANSINRRLSKEVKREFNVDINYRNLYLLGFYDTIVKTCGEDRAKELVTSVRNSKDTEDLMKLAREYGVAIDNVTYLKRLLRPFI